MSSTVSTTEACQEWRLQVYHGTFYASSCQVSISTCEADSRVLHHDIAKAVSNHHTPSKWVKLSPTFSSNLKGGKNSKV